MSMITLRSEDNAHQSSYITAATMTNTKIINDGNETSTLCDIKILCFERKKVCSFESRSRSENLMIRISDRIKIQLRIKGKTIDITGLYSRSKDRVCRD